MAMENISIPSPSSSSSSLLSPLPSPPVAWHNFLERMRHPSAAGFVKSIKSFIVSFSSKVPDPEKDSASVQQFLANMEAAFKAHILWANSSEEELESASEGLEKYVMTKLFNRAFTSLPEDVQSDEELFEKIALLQQFVRPENLDIKPAFQNETAWLLAEKELQKINMYKAPRDKLMCILNCCKVINNLLLNASVASDNNPPGADDFLPVLIYVTIKANPPQLHSNLVYIQRYRRQSQLVSEAAYYFTNILSAEAFLWNIDAHSLSMDEVEFQMKMESARAHYLGLSTHIESPTNIDNQNPNEQSIEKSKKTGNHMSIGEHCDIHQVHKESKDGQILDRPSISSLEEKGVTELLKDEQFSSYFHEYPYLHANVGDLTINDVHSLLDGYKKVVLMYVTLSKGIQVSSNRPDSSTVKESENGTGEVINGG